jgi:glycosyltransferase involved in cell wall biosynthesis
VTTTLLVPALNEIEGMKQIMPRVRREWVDEILVIDGGSTDGTLEYAATQGYRVLRQQSKGITNAYREALPHVRGDVVVTFSPDGNSVPERIPDLLRKMAEGYDMVIASRYADGARSEDDDPLTRFGNRLFTGLVNVLFRGHYSDALVMLRAFRKEIVGDLPEDVPRAGLELWLSIRCAKRRLKVTEIPGDEPRRIGGIRKMQPVLNGLDIMRLIGRELWSRA